MYARTLAGSWALLTALACLAAESCPECGRVVSVEYSREAPATQRAPGYQDSPEYRDSRNLRVDPQYGAALRFNFGPGDGPRGPGVGSEAQREGKPAEVYEILMRFDDGRYARIQQRGPVDLRPGDPVRLERGRVLPQ